MSEKLEKAEEASLVKRALHALELMRAKAAALEQERTEPIAIIGMGCRFPGGANDLESYWQLLHEGREAIKEVPADRWNIDTFYDSDPDAAGKMYTRWGGFLDHVDMFDPAFFGITPREATSIDPQQRLVLEVAWEALENSGLVPDQLSGSKTGVFIGVSNNEYSWHEIANPKHINAYSGTGNAYNVIAGRLSYLLNLQGPSMAVDTACSSSLLSIHLACQSLRNRESHLALAGGVNLMLAPQGTIVMTKIHALSGDGRCKTFDARADGFVRSEGCGMVVLKRLSDAQADGDPILALVRGSAVNQDGRSSGLTAPNVVAQCTVLREALANARVAPERISYVETHGTGTPLGDPIEVEALTEVLAHNQPSSQCVLGAVKTNMGHLEAAAGVAGLIKVVLSMQHEEIPGNLHFNELNPNIRLKGTHFVVPTTNQDWPKGEQRRYAGVSAFGWAGTNAHMILEEAPALTVPSAQGEPELPDAYILPLAARSPQALRALIQSYSSWLPEHAELSTYDICAAASLHRTHHDYRAALVGANSQALLEQAQLFLEEDTTVEPMLAGPRKVVFVFAGQGTHYASMGLQLLEQEPVFREQLQACDQLLQQFVSWSLLTELAAPPERSRLNHIEIAQPVLFSIQISLAALWQSWGVLPTAVIGHSVGEVAAAYVAGALSLAQALQLVALRGRLLQEAEGTGDMALVEVAASELEQLLLPWKGRVEIAARNGPTTTVLSGEPQALQEAVEQMQQQGCFARSLHVGFASHCSQMAPYAVRLQEALEQDTSWQSVPTQIPFYSTVQHRRIQGEALDARYWGRNVVESVGFAETMQTLLADSSPCLLEISPHPILRHALRQCVRTYAAERVGEEHEKPVSEGAIVGSLQRERAERETLLQSLGQLYSQGVEINWSGVYRRRGQMVAVPTYPFQRERFWHEGWKNGREEWLDFQSKEQERHPLLPLETCSSVEAGVWYRDGIMSVEQTEYLGDHRLQRTVVVPGAVYLEGVIAAAQRRYAGSRVQLEQVHFRQMLTLSEQPGASRRLQLALMEDTKEYTETAVEGRQVRFQFSSRDTEHDLTDAWKVHSTGILRLDSDNKELPAEELLATIKARCSQVCTQEEIYARLDAQGTNYGPAFQGIEQIWLGEKEALARLQLPEMLERDVNGYWIHPAFFDACLHVSLVMQHFAEENVHRQNIAMPVYVETIRIHQRPGKQVWSHVRFSQENGAVLGTTHLLNEKGQILVELIGSRIQQLEEIQQPETHTWAPSSSAIQNWLYNLNWRVGIPQITDALPRVSTGPWWIFADEHGLGRELATIMEGRGEQTILVFSGTTFEQKSRTHFCISPEQPADLERLYATLLAAGMGNCGGIIHLWSMNSVPDEHVTVSSLNAGHMQGSGSLLHLVQILAHTSWHQEPPRLWLVTQGAQHLETDMLPVALIQSMVWGFGRGIAQEHADLWGGLVDLEPGADPHATVVQLWEHIQANDGEDQVAFRQQQRYVARLERQQVAERSDVPLVWQTNASYLITGGLGGLGSGLAHWMVQQGARHLILMGRTALPPRRQWSQLSPQHDLYQTVKRIRELEGMGASIHLATVDVANETQLTHFLATYKDEGWPAIRGVVHAAGVSHYQPIQELNVDVLRADFQPKVLGSWLLYQALRDEALDFFVLFSSAAVLLSPAFLASYAASNAFMDALAHYGQAQGRTILSINWGYWSQIGMVAHLQQETYSLIARGISAMRPEQGLEVFNYLQRYYTGAQIVVMPMNWLEWRQYYPGSANSPYLSQLMEPTESEAENDTAVVTTTQQVTSQQILSLPQEERLPRLITYLQQRIANIFHIASSSLDIQQPINKLGMDSLMALELKIQITVDLEVTFPVVKMLQGPTIVQLATQLLDQMLLATLVQSQTTAATMNDDYEEIEL